MNIHIFPNFPQFSFLEKKSLWLRILCPRGSLRSALLRRPLAPAFDREGFLASAPKIDTDSTLCSSFLASAALAIRSPAGPKCETGRRRPIWSVRPFDRRNQSRLVSLATEKRRAGNGARRPNARDCHGHVTWILFYFLFEKKNGTKCIELWIWFKEFFFPF